MPMWNPLREVPLTEELLRQRDALGINMEGSTCTCWVNDRYQVYRYVQDDEGIEGMVWLSIKLRSREPIHDWRHMQQIKNELVGPEREGIELYPAESRIVDSSNQYHLWVMPKDADISLGFPGGLVMGPEAAATVGAKQRAWEDGLTTGQAIKESTVEDGELRVRIGEKK